MVENVCIICSELFSEERAKLGYNTCLKHGEKPKIFTTMVAYNKGPYQLVTKKYIKDAGKKG
jgi:hypothetical protein